ncbi:MAG: hypothetical protein WCP91_02690 [Candidatus Berkelbacteria bacterium]
MVNEAGDPALVGVEFGKVTEATERLHGYVKMPIESDELRDINAQLEVLISEVSDTADKENADKLAEAIRKHFLDVLNQPLDLKIDLKKDPQEKYSGREDTRVLIDQLAALASKYSEFEVNADQNEEADESGDSKDAAAA